MQYVKKAEWIKDANEQKQHAQLLFVKTNISLYYNQRSFKYGKNTNNSHLEAL